MLSQLQIRNFVLIEALELDFAVGLTTLTGETGAGKSILLDALGVLLGERAEPSQIRASATQAQLAAVFTLTPHHPAQAWLVAAGYETGAELVVRRTLMRDGKNRQFINDTPVTAQALRQLAPLLLEVHGQFANQELLQPTTQRSWLDTYGNYPQLLQTTAAAWQAWQEAAAHLAAQSSQLQVLANQQEDLTAQLAELERLAPQTGEASQLQAARQQAGQGQKLQNFLGEISQSLQGPHGASRQLAQVLTKLERQTNPALPEALQALLPRLATCQAELADLANQIEALASARPLSASELAALDDRYFALKETARKYRYDADQLPDLLAQTRTQLASLTQASTDLAALQAAVAKAEKNYLQAAAALRQARQAAAPKLAAAIMAEFAPLKLAGAALQIAITPGPAAAHGQDQIEFLVRTNAGQPFGPVAKIASGGELARLMLALRVVTQAHPHTTLIFDEVDAGMGGAVAAAVGARLARLAEQQQVLAVTHSPQVAACGHQQWQVSKQRQGRDQTMTQVTPLLGDARQAELARMLAGAEVTPAAMAAAAQLLAAAHAAAPPAPIAARQANQAKMAPKKAAPKKPRAA